MQKSEDHRYVLSPTDLARHLACRHLTALSQSVADGRLERPRRFDPRAEVLAERGRRHERDYLDHLRRQGLRVEVADGAEGAGTAAATLELLRRGVDAVAQATLRHGDWQGRADVLRRVERASALGPWSYEVVDTKLGRATKAATILQLCTYSALLAEVQGLRPEWMHVVPPECRYEAESFLVDDFAAYFERVRRRLVDEVATDPHTRDTYPHPTDHCDVCAWWRDCDARRRRDDHLCLVAGMSRLHEAELRALGVDTRAELAALLQPLVKKPSRGSAPMYELLREQARIQLASPPAGPPLYERLPAEAGMGLARLPAPSAGDVFLDFEGDSFVGADGLEYLAGWVTFDDGGAAEYHAHWATDRRAEQDALERLVDALMERWKRYPDFHVYHFTPYEPAAVKRLMGRYAAREDEVDRLLRGGRFIDLHGVVRQGLRVGVESYSLKNLEALYGYQRGLDLREASRALLRVEVALELGLTDEISPEERGAVERYNRDDCLSTLGLRDWLERVRAEAVSQGEVLPRPTPEDPEPSETLTQWQETIRPVQERLHADLGDDPEAWSDEERARWLLGHLLDFHRRESKVDWWDFFRLAEMSAEERFDEPKAIAGLVHAARIPQYGKGGRALLPVDRYTFPSQEVDERPDEARLEGGAQLGQIVAIDGSEGWLEVRKRKDSVDLHPSSIFMFSRVQERVLQESLLRIAGWVAAHGVEAQGEYRPARELLLCRPPRLRGGRGIPLLRDGEASLAAARRLALELDGGVLPIQGPPGAGKTYTAARMIVELVRAGRKVGITALSHKVIRNLLDETVKAAREEGLQGLRCIQKISNRDEPAEESVPIEETQDNGRVLAALASGEASVAGGTAWLWAREEMAGSVDALFVDEAGQLSLATTLAASPAGRSLVLVGDPQQLEQPIQGTHPDGTGEAALQHLLGEHDTIPEDRGLFLAETHRLHPEICRFTSDLYYEGRLRAVAKNANLGFHAPPPFDRCGLYWVPVEHEGNQSESEEEAEVVAGLVHRWLHSGAEWTDAEGERHPLTLDDVLIVAPYNAQVSRLKQRLPQGRIGTVDKFQGQGAPVVVYSMTTSSPADAPHGMSFLYSRHRLNVATSRARCAVVLIAGPRLLEPECRTPEQIRLANGLCLFAERATEVAAGGIRPG